VIVGGGDCDAAQFGCTAYESSAMKIVTAGILLIGDELLSGRTQDTNLATIAAFLAPLGVSVGEARILPDNADVIARTVRTFSEQFDYVFTTGGIGPTHDDITADCIAAAFDLGITEREDALESLRERYSEGELNAARRRMARIPDGASLIANPVSQAPGFQTRNVFTLAGVPQIMRGMLADIGHRIEGGAKTYQISVTCSGIGEGDAAAPLAKIEADHPGVSIGSYPFFNADLRGLSFVARGPDETQLARVESDLKALVASLTRG
jgi:molybdenum cofactor synthesis domain-containing protein